MSAGKPRRERGTRGLEWATGLLLATCALQPQVHRSCGWLLNRSQQFRHAGWPLPAAHRAYNVHFASRHLYDLPVAASPTGRCPGFGVNIWHLTPLSPPRSNVADQANMTVWRASRE